MRITKTGEYGVLICFTLAREWKSARDGGREITPLGGGELGFQLSISIDSVRQITRHLRESGILTSVKGPGGGFILARNPEAINVRQILDAGERETFQIICETETIECGNVVSPDCCPVHYMWQELKQHIDTFLEEHSLAWLVDCWETLTRAQVASKQ